MKPLPTKYVNKVLDLRYKIEILRQIVCEEDMPYPMVPEGYIEQHESIKKILEYIDTELMEEEEE